MSPLFICFLLPFSLLPYSISPLVSSVLTSILSDFHSQMIRQRVKEQIAQDRAAFAAQREAEKQGALSQDLKAAQPKTQQPQSKPAQKKDYDTCRLQVSLHFTCSELFMQVVVLVKTTDPVVEVIEVSCYGVDRSDDS